MIVERDIVMECCKPVPCVKVHHHCSIYVPTAQGKLAELLSSLYGIEHDYFGSILSNLAKVSECVLRNPKNLAIFYLAKIQVHTAAMFEIRNTQLLTSMLVLIFWMERFQFWIGQFQFWIGQFQFCSDIFWKSVHLMICSTTHHMGLQPLVPYCSLPNV